MVNSLTHAVGLALSIGGAIVLLALASIYGDRWHLIGCSVYGATLVMAYAASTLYHASGSSLHKKFLQQVDQSFIYLLIAGTYTPFTLVPLSGGWGWSLLAIVWSVAIAGIGVKVLFADRFQGASVPVCLCLGWLCVIAIVPLLESLPLDGVMWLLLGGGAYTLGVGFLRWRPLPFSHGLWHIAVMVGSACHYVAIAWYVIPLA
jgi:hemolysin III